MPSKNVQVSRSSYLDGSDVFSLYATPTIYVHTIEITTRVRWCF